MRSGPIFPTDDFVKLAALALELLTSEEQLGAQRTRQAQHLAKFTAKTVAARYLDALQQAAKS